MKWTSALAIFMLFWVMSAFIIMPIGVKTAEEMGAEKVPGQSESAPANFNPWRIIARTTILAAALFGVYYLNFVNGWVTTDMLDFVN